MTAQDWKKYGKHWTDTTRCPFCGKPIIYGDESVTYAKTRRGTHVYAHEKCAGLKGGSHD